MSQDKTVGQALEDLSRSLKAYKIAGMADHVHVQMSGDAVEALGRLCDAVRSIDDVVDAAEDRLRAEIAKAASYLDRIRAEAIGIVAWVLILSLASVAWALAITAGLGL